MVKRSIWSEGMSDTFDGALEREHWEGVRALFNLRRDRIHMAGFLLPSHPKCVREAIERHRQGLDENPVEYLEANQDREEANVLSAAARYMGVQPGDIALTDSTTMGLGLLYGGLSIARNQEILTTIHDHYATGMSLRLRAQQTGASLRRISLYRNSHTVTPEEILDTFVEAVRPETRIVAITWVHSGTGVKLPISEMADALDKLNSSREPGNRALLCVDGVHGFGVEDAQMEQLGCDFFVSGCHKWLFGPRGTGLIWGKPKAWRAASSVIPASSREMFEMWLREFPNDRDASRRFGIQKLARAGHVQLLELLDGNTSGINRRWSRLRALLSGLGTTPPTALFTPGGYHSFEHRWALAEAFHFHAAIGRTRIAERIRMLNLRLKAGLAEMKHVTLHTPMAEQISAGIVCFEIDGLCPEEVVARLRMRGIIASVAPYSTRYARLSPGLLNSPEEVDVTLYEVAKLAKQRRIERNLLNGTNGMRAGNPDRIR